MKVADLSPAELRSRLGRSGIYLRIDPFTVRLQSSLPGLAQAVGRLYADYALASGDYADFHVRLALPNNPRRWIRPQVDFYFDGRRPFKPLPAVQVYPFFEWGLNWCIANHSNQYLIIHAAVLERAGRALLMPGAPGSGKSTLCAALVARGWRLLSDELALIALAGLDATPVPRPISLKNESIGVIKAFAVDAVIGPETHDTAKGTVAHMRPPRDSIALSAETAAPGWIVFPRYAPDAELSLEPEGKSRAFMRLAENVFNRSALGLAGFEALGGLIDRCDCYAFNYTHLDQAVAVFDRLACADRA